jgi:aryl-alcohol dehydrogenase-like predicted oxidoreductase
MQLARRPLGKSGLEITAVGFGAWATGGGGWAFGWGPQDDAASTASIHHAVRLGINWIDTAAVYGLGHSEEVVGRAVRALPAAERPLVFTKCGLQWDEKNPMVQARRSLHPDLVRRGCEDSLRRLGVERIDLFQFHWPDESGVALEDSWAAMAKLVEEGKVRTVGVSNFDVARLEKCQRIRQVDSLQPPFSAVRRQAAEREIPWCAAHGAGVIVYSPMQSGLLTDTFTEERMTTLPADDWRSKSPHFQPPNLAKNLALRDALRPLAARRGVSVGALAVAWTLAWPGVSGAIVGARSPEQVDGWIAAAGLELDAGELDAIAAAIEKTGAGGGPARPPMGLPAARPHL